VNLGIALLSSLFLAPHAVAATPLPSPKAALTVSTVSAKRWTMRVENTGDVPVRIVADPYLLSLEIMVPAGGDGSSKKAAKAHTVRCSLPADMRPSSDTSRGLVLPPGTAYSESFDPRMYCFGARESAGLVRGARVIAHYGFSAPHGAKKKGAALPPPFVVSPIASAEHPNQASAAPVKELIGASALELSSDAVASAPTPTAEVQSRWQLERPRRSAHLSRRPSRKMIPPTRRSASLSQPEARRREPGSQPPRQPHQRRAEACCRLFSPANRGFQRSGSRRRVRLFCR